MAYRRYLASLAEDQLPSELRGTFSQVMRSLAGVKPLRGEEAVVASVRKMSNQDADDCATLIVEMFGLLCRAQNAAQNPSENPAARHGAAVVQLRPVECAAPEFEAPALAATN
ncbi:MAG TPA: hypothetical protein VK437_08910 [Steroidobacteraceae bacterium]|nr:hypothetical protein [Steroidobacteraceae bacterium]